MAAMRTVAHHLSSLRVAATGIGGLLVCFANLAIGAPEQIVYFPLASGMEWVMDLHESA
jgi:hypothetical protein